MNALEKRIIELSFRHKLTHVSSCLNTVNLLDWIYGQRTKDEPVIVDNGHASLAHYVVLEKYGWCDAEEMVKKHGTHSSRDMEHGIWCSNGSLGQAATVAVGMALADPNRTVWLVTSDGACMEGCVYEVQRAAFSLSNLKGYVVFNGFGAYDEISDFATIFTMHRVDQNRYPEWLRGLPGHYLKLSKQQYEELMA